MNYDMLMIHFGELSTKGNNRKLFINKLAHNVKIALKKYALPIRYDHDHIYVSLLDKDPDEIAARLGEVSGIGKISLVAKCSKEREDIISSCASLMEKENKGSFKVDVNRADKSYMEDTYKLTCDIADAILDLDKGFDVDVHKPDLLLKVNIREDGVYIYCHQYPGLGGYPLGMSGKAMMLLSGGIDSPVAAYELIRRGISIECVHFSSPPYTSTFVIDKLKDILIELNEYQPDIKLEVVHFTKLQEAIYDNVDEPYCITIMRRMMLRIAEGVAKKNKCLALATGESIGQVASQTLESLQSINDVTSFPVIRPLAVSDKTSIIDKAKKIGTYDISIRPYEDCCTIFKPKRPKTKPKISECEYFESKFDWKPLVEECIASCSPIYISEGKEIFPAGSLSNQK